MSVGSVGVWRWMKTASHLTSTSFDAAWQAAWHRGPSTMSWQLIGSIRLPRVFFKKRCNKKNNGAGARAGFVYFLAQREGLIHHWPGPAGAEESALMNGLHARAHTHTLTVSQGYRCLSSPLTTTDSQSSCFNRVWWEKWVISSVEKQCRNANAPQSFPPVETGWVVSAWTMLLFSRFSSLFQLGCSLDTF